VRPIGSRTDEAARSETENGKAAMICDRSSPNYNSGAKAVKRPAMPLHTRVPVQVDRTHCRLRPEPMASQVPSTIALPEACGFPSSLEPTVRLGGWLFRRRSWLPLPIIAALVLLLHPARSTLVVCVGLALVTLGEALRVWESVTLGSSPHAQRPSRTSGGQWPIWLCAESAVSRQRRFVAGVHDRCRPLWLAPLILLVLAVEYHPIVRWEEGLLTERLGEPYRALRPGPAVASGHETCRLPPARSLTGFAWPGPRCLHVARHALQRTKHAARRRTWVRDPLAEILMS
jgi:hypothetical protein